MLPTPTATQYGSNQSSSPGAAVRPSLDGVVRMLPTPRASDGAKGGPNQRGSSGDLMLPSAVMAMLPTPRAMDGHASMTAPAARKHVADGNGSLAEVLGAHLHP